MPGSPDDTIVGTVDGTIVGYVTPHQQELVVHPDHRRRGIGTRLVEAGLAYARTHDQPALTLAPPPGNAGAEAFATRLGFAYDSSLWQLRLPPGRDVDRPVFPPAVVARPFTADVDLGRYVGMINSAFVDHPSPIMVTIDVVTMAHSRPEFVPDNICLLGAAADPDTPIGVLPDAGRSRRRGAADRRDQSDRRPGAMARSGAWPRAAQVGRVASPRAWRRRPDAPRRSQERAGPRTLRTYWLRPQPGMAAMDAVPFPVRLTIGRTRHSLRQSRAKYIVGTPSANGLSRMRFGGRPHTRVANPRARS